MDFLLQGVSSHLRPYLFVVVLLNALSCGVVGGVTVGTIQGRVEVVVGAVLWERLW